MATNKFIMDEDSTYHGKVKSKAYENVCIDHMQRDLGYKMTPYTLGQYGCQGEDTPHTQYFSFSQNKELRNEFMCAEARDGLIQMSACVGGKKSQKWEYNKQQQLKHVESGLCLSCPP